MLTSSLRQSNKTGMTHSLLATAQFGFRKNYQPGYYNMRFKPSQGRDGNYIATNAPYHGPDGAEPVSISAPTSFMLSFSFLTTLTHADQNGARPKQGKLRDEHDQH